MAQTSIPAAFPARIPSEISSNTRQSSGFTPRRSDFKETFDLPDSVEEIKNAWNTMAMHKYTHEVPLKTGMLEFLKQLKKNGIRTGIATSNSLELVGAVLKSLSVEEYFDEVHTACEVAKGKPAPDIYLLVAERLGVTPPRQCQPSKAYGTMHAFFSSSNIRTLHVPVSSQPPFRKAYIKAVQYNPQYSNLPIAVFF